MSSGGAQSSCVSGAGELNFFAYFAEAEICERETA